MLFSDAQNNESNNLQIKRDQSDLFCLSANLLVLLCGDNICTQGNYNSLTANHRK